MNTPEKKPPGDSGGRRPPVPPARSGPQRPQGAPPPGSRPAGRPGPGASGGQRPPAPKGVPDPYDDPDAVVTTPRAPDESGELVFMTHAPGASVGPRPVLQLDEEVKAFEEKLKKDEEKKEEKKEAAAAKARPKAAEPAAAAPKRPAAAQAKASIGTALAESAARMSEGAGVGAIARTLTAARGAQLPAEQVAAPRGPSFWAQLPGALVTPLRKGSLGAALGGTALLIAALLLLEISPYVGVAACVVAALELIALRVKLVREVGGGRDDAVWPALTDAVSSLPLFVGAAFVLLPAIITAGLAVGPSVWDARDPRSVPARAARAWSPPEASAPGTAPDSTAAGGEEAPDVLGRQALSILDALVGRAPSEVGAPDARTARQIALDIAATTRARASALLDPAGASTLGKVSRLLLLIGLGLFPMALLAASRLKSAYAAWLPPVLLRGMLRAPLPYLVTCAAWLVQVAVMLAALLLLPAALQVRLEPVGAHLATVLIVSALAVNLPLVTGALLGRFYRAHAHVLAWE